MKLVNFEVKKFKGIGNLKISFSTTPNNKVYTLVGINDENHVIQNQLLSRYQ